MNTKKDVVIIGAGQAGLAASYWLKGKNIDHIILERGRTGESWRSHRWDSFYLNTPNWSNDLPGMTFNSETPNEFSSRDTLVGFFEKYVREFELPLKENAEVKEVVKLPSGEFRIETNDETYQARVVLLSSGSMSQPRIPDMADRLPAEVLSLSAGTYKSAKALPDGAVLVVGTGQSGCQIVEDLLQSGREVYCCASSVARVPRFYRGKDIVAWMKDLGMLDTRVSELEDTRMQFDTQPQVSGTDGGHTVSLQSLARDGAILLGRLEGIEDQVLIIDDNLIDSIRFADEKSAMIKKGIDGFIEKAGIDAPPPAPDPGEPDLPDLNQFDKITKLNLQKSHITTVIWCCGFDADWSWVKANVFDDEGRPVHIDGISNVEGLYFLGFPWLSKRKSGIIYGIVEDSQRITHHIREFLNAKD